MKRICLLLLACVVLTGCAPDRASADYMPYDKPIVETYCPEHQASTEIAVKDGAVYCAYLETSDGTERYAIDVFENGAWKRVETVMTSVYEHPLFADRVSYDPLTETVGDYTLYTDEDYTLYLHKQNTAVHYELPGGGLGLRRVATDHRSKIAVLTSETTVVDGLPMAKLYLITLE